MKCLSKNISSGMISSSKSSRCSRNSKNSGGRASWSSSNSRTSIAVV